MSRFHSIAAIGIILLGVSQVFADDSDDDIADRAVKEFRADDFPAAERDFRVIVKRDPSNLFAQFYLGQCLFREGRYAEAAVFFQKARDLEKNGKSLSPTLDRILTDQLVMSYGISGELNKASGLLADAIARDPDYPLNYYNLACLDAEEKNKPAMLADLKRAFDHKANVLIGEQMPDPREDSSFEKYRSDPDFIALMKQLGFH